jgi:hypothetical protein
MSSSLRIEKILSELRRELRKEIELEMKLEKEIKLPWSGVKEECCMNLNYEGGLYVQCRGMKSVNGYCESCKSEGEYGTTEERMKVDINDYIDPSGRKVVHYSKIMKKMNINKEDVLRRAEELGEKVAECHFLEVKSKRGRPRKEKQEEPKEKKKRGRPRKEKNVSSNNSGEDLIASLLENSNKNETKIEEKTETSADEKTELETNLNNNIDEEEEETNVIRFEINGKVYLKSEENILFDYESHDAIGMWNEENKEIEDIPDEDED